MYKNFGRKKRFRKLRAQIKGAQKQKQINAPFFVEKLYYELAGIPLEMSKNNTPKSLIANHHGIIDLLIRQTILLNRKDICSAIMMSLGSGVPAILPIPQPFIEYLESKGIKINHLASKLSLYKFSLKRLLKGIYQTIVLLLQYRLAIFDGEKYVVFLDLNSNCIPDIDKNHQYNR